MVKFGEENISLFKLLAKIPFATANTFYLHHLHKLQYI